MSSKVDSTRTQSDANAPTSMQNVAGPAGAEESHAKPPIFWMMVPILLIGLALYFAR